MAKNKKDSEEFLNDFQTDETHFLLHGNVNIQNSNLWATSNPPKYKSHCNQPSWQFDVASHHLSLQDLSLRPCTILHWKMLNKRWTLFHFLMLQYHARIKSKRRVIFNKLYAECRATILCESNKMFPIEYLWWRQIDQSSSEVRMTSMITLVDIWLWYYLKLFVYYLSASNLTELKDFLSWGLFSSFWHVAFSCNGCCEWPLLCRRYFYSSCLTFVI